MPPPARATIFAEHDCTTFIVPHHVKRVLTDIDTDHGDPRIELVGHGLLLVIGAPWQLRLLAGPEHGRTIPLAETGRIEIPQRSGLLCLVCYRALAAYEERPHVQSPGKDFPRRITWTKLSIKGCSFFLFVWGNRKGTG